MGPIYLCACVVFLCMFDHTQEQNNFNSDDAWNAESRIVPGNGFMGHPGFPHRPDFQQVPGYQGPPGFQSAPGFQGPPGFQSPPGFQNPPEIQGFPGFQDPPGFQGLPGHHSDMDSQFFPEHMHPALIPLPTEAMPIRHANAPRELAVYPAPLPDSDHELMFNVSWAPPEGIPPTDYSLEVRSVTRTSDCDTPMCYEYNIPGARRWWLVPAHASPLATACAVRPGCSYEVRVTAHPWDGRSAANLSVELDECVAGVCSCGHAPRLPAPQVSARILTVEDEIFVNVTWSLPPPSEPLRLPPSLKRASYFVSIGKQMVSDAHPSPWFAHTVTRRVPAKGSVILGDRTRWVALPLANAKRVRMLARVSVIDDRGCSGPPGNGTVNDPRDEGRTALRSYALWIGVGGALVLVSLAAATMGARGVKRLIHILKPAPAPLEPLRRRPAWLPLLPAIGMTICQDATVLVQQQVATEIQPNDLVVNIAGHRQLSSDRSESRLEPKDGKESILKRLETESDNEIRTENGTER